MSDELEEIAIVGMACRVPGARNINEFWDNLRDGVESIHAYSADELTSSGADASLVSDPNFVNAGAVMEDADCFDAEFFGFNVREAQMMDPQHRMFLETSWEALENAGYNPENYNGQIGVFGGVAPNSYFQNNLMTRPELLQMVGSHAVKIATASQYAITRVSYKLDLKGPSISINTACSTSGVAIHLACQSLLSGESDMVLAGGSRIKAPLKEGYLYVEGGILSPDGHCRAFDAKAQGMVVGSGAAIVVLKRLTDAFEDGDTIHAVIKGTAINNDGAQKIGFTAPSKQGQAAAIMEAQAVADVEPDSISYIEAHGTATALGDPIEIAALTQAFREHTQEKNFCAIGSVKTNIGHLDAAAGTIGIIKTALAMQHHQIPPSLNFDQPNPQIDFENSPFYVNNHLSEWKRPQNHRRRAGVSSFGLGGTNSHVVLEEAPDPPTSSESRNYQLLVVSGRSEETVVKAAHNLGRFLLKYEDSALADVAYTLQVGRQHFTHRRYLICEDRKNAIEKLMAQEVGMPCEAENGTNNIVFMFSGQGAQFPNMGKDLYLCEPVFREAVDYCLAKLKPLIDIDLLTVLYPDPDELEKSRQLMSQTSITQPVLFIVEYALAKLWESWGVVPSAMIGHSLGEYVVACISGVFTLDAALELIAIRGRLMQSVGDGAMLAIALPENEVSTRMGPDTSIAALNTSSQCVVSGTPLAIESLQRDLEAESIQCKRLRVSMAAHSPMMDTILAEFETAVKQANPQPPGIPFVSNTTGSWITDVEAQDTKYWVGHLRNAVRYCDGLTTLLDSEYDVLLEVGPGRSLSMFAQQHSSLENAERVITSMRSANEEENDQAQLLTAIGKMWATGLEIRWNKLYGNEKRRRVPLPTYPFERKQYWINARLPKEGLGEQPFENAASVSATNSEQAHATESGGKTDSNLLENILLQIRNVMHLLTGIPVEEINDSKTFLSQGFDSLLITRANSAYQKQFGVALPQKVLFEEAPTPAKLAYFLKSRVSSTLSFGVEESKQPAGDEVAGVPGVDIENTLKETINGLNALIVESAGGETQKLLEDLAIKQKRVLAQIQESRIEDHAASIETVPAGSRLCRQPRENSLPLSFAQQRLWYLDQLIPNRSAYNLPSALRMSGPLDLALLKDCIGELLERHEILRAHFQTGEEVNLIIENQLQTDLPCHDLSAFPADVREQKLTSLLESRAGTPFDLEKGPLFDLFVVFLSAEEHVLCFNTHHSISDGWSLGIFRREIAALYKAGKNNISHDLPELDIQYADYSIWQRNLLQGKELERLSSHWKSVLDGEIPVLELPLDHARPAIQTYKGSTLNIHIPSDIVKSLSRIGDDNNATLYMVLLTAFKIFLHRYTRQNDIIVGSPIANRTRPELESLLGFFANTLILRTRLDGQNSFSQSLVNVRDVCFEAYEYQDMPFEKLVEVVNPPRDLSRTPIFQAMFGYMDISNRATGMADITLEPIRVDNATARTDLTLFLSRENAEVSGFIEYSSDLFDEETIQRMSENFLVLLDSIVSNPNVEIGLLPLLSSSEQELLVHAQAGSPVEIPQTCIHCLFEDQVSKTEDNIAVVHRGQSLSYSELNARANILANTLLEAGVGSGSLVAIYLERSIETLVALLAILKAGAAYLPIDTTHPEERVAYILEDAQVDAIVTTSQDKEKLRHINTTIIGIDCPDQHSAVATQDANLNVVVDHNDIAYVIYTSGSTGKPKGVQVKHSNVVNFLLSMRNEPGISSSDRLLAITTLSFDIAVLELLLPLIEGACVVIASVEESADGRLLREVLENEKINVMQATPASWRILLASGWRGGTGKFRALCGGESFPEDLAGEMLDCGIEVWNMYGPTETTVWSTCFQLNRKNQPPVLIGRPIANTQVYVLDGRNNTLPVGVWGEMAIGGKGVTAGYLRRPRMTNDRYIADVTGGENDTKLYRTGDVVRFMADGNIEYKGRFDNQVKIRGYRIELGEVTSVLREIDEVENAGVVVREFSAEDRRMIAYVVLNSPVDTQFLLAKLRNKLPRYMVPQHVVHIDTLPLTPNGKLDLSALPEPEGFSGASASSRNRGPDTLTERIVNGIVCDVLNVQQVDCDESFFNIGGHSLLALKVISRLKEETGVRVSAGTMVMDSLRGIAAEIDQSDRPGGGVNDSFLATMKNMAAKLNMARLWS